MMKLMREIAKFGAALMLFSVCTLLLLGIGALCWSIFIGIEGMLGL
jgi:hypothetical protein